MPDDIANANGPQSAPPSLSGSGTFLDHAAREMISTQRTVLLCVRLDQVEGKGQPFSANIPLRQELSPTPGSRRTAPSRERTLEIAHELFEKKIISRETLDQITRVLAEGVLPQDLKLAQETLFQELCKARKIRIEEFNRAKQSVQSSGDSKEFRALLQKAKEEGILSDKVFDKLTEALSLLEGENPKEGITKILDSLQERGLLQGVKLEEIQKLLESGELEKALVKLLCIEVNNELYLSSEVLEDRIEESVEQFGSLSDEIASQRTTSEKRVTVGGLPYCYYVPPTAKSSASSSGTSTPGVLIPHFVLGATPIDEMYAPAGLVPGSEAYALWVGNKQIADARQKEIDKRKDEENAAELEASRESVIADQIRAKAARKGNHITVQTRFIDLALISSDGIEILTGGDSGSSTLPEIDLDSTRRRVSRGTR